MKVKVCQKVIRELRVNKGWTQEKFAEVSGVHTRTIQRIENDGIASLQSLNGLARALGVEPKSLQHIETHPKTHSEAHLETHAKTTVQTIAQQPVHTDHKDRPIELTAMTYKGKRHFKKVLQDAEKTQTWLLNECAAWAILFIGGFLTINVLLLTQANPGSPTIFKVFLPGTAIGLLLMLTGGVSVQLSKEAREQESHQSSKWVAWIFLLSGSFITVNALFLTQTNLVGAALFGVFAIGLLLLLVGGIGVLLSTSEKARKQSAVAEQH